MDNVVPYFFLSYSRRDEKEALRVKNDLEQAGFQIWMDRHNIQPGERWDDNVREAIKKCVAILYLASPNSRSSPNVLHEIDLAMMYDRHILPLWIAGDTSWPDVAVFGLSRNNYIDMRSNKYKMRIPILVHEIHITLDDYAHSADSSEKAPHLRSISQKETDAEFSEHTLHTLHTLHKEDGMSRLATNVLSSLSTKRPFLFGTSALKRAQKLFLRSSHQRLAHPPAIPTTSYLSHLRNPYKGLYAFRYDDAHDFFGRERLISEMVQQVKHIVSEEKQYSQASRCMLVVGASGAGKSSVVMAGLLPELQKSQPVSEIKRWLFLEPVNPGERPIDSLAYTLHLPFLNNKEVGPSMLATRSLTALRQELDDPSARGLLSLLQNLTPDPHDRAVLVIDQFEELFAPSIDQTQREAFIDLLFTVATEPYSRTLIIVTLRADFYDYILKYPHLFEIMKSHRIDIPPMTPQEIRDVIEKPVQSTDVNVTFDADLTGDLVFEMRERPEALPLLQFVLEKLFEQREGCRLTRHSYDALGGLQGAIDRHAETTYDDLPSDQHREYAHQLFTQHFIHLTETRDELARLEYGEGITRRRVMRAELQLDDPENTIARETVDAFTTARLLIARSAMRQTTRLEESTYEISHEALINAWKRLRQWIEIDREDIYLVQRLRPRIAEWQKEQQRKKKREFLLEKRELKQFQSYSQRKVPNLQEKRFMIYNIRSRQRKQIINSVSLLLLILIFPLGLFVHNILSPDPSIVTSSKDYGNGSLQQAIEYIEQTKSGKPITFASSLMGKTISLNSGDLLINQKITIQGPTNGTITISSGSTAHVIEILQQGNVTFENITFSHSSTHLRSLIMNNGNLTMNNCIITQNKSYNNGGAITNNSHLTLNDTTLSYNQNSGNGGAIYNMFGIININGGKITDNIAYNNGGGIYSRGGNIEIFHSKISRNTASDPTTPNNYGGGIDIVDGFLGMSDNTTISENASNYYGGGIALQGSYAQISNTTIDHNQAGQQGGGMIVAANTDNSFSSQVTLSNIAITDTPGAYYYIGQNISNNSREKSTSNIAGNQTISGPLVQIYDEPNNPGIAGNPPPITSTPNTPLPIGTADVNRFCRNKGYSNGTMDSYGSNIRTIDSDILIKCTGNASPRDFPGNVICQSQFGSRLNTAENTFDRILNYYDPSTLECFTHVKILGTIGDPADFDKACTSYNTSTIEQNTGLYDNHLERKKAYDWKCQPKDPHLLPRGLSVATACQLKYKNSLAFDRLVNFNQPDGWECFAPA